MRYSVNWAAGMRLALRKQVPYGIDRSTREATAGSQYNGKASYLNTHPLCLFRESGAMLCRINHH